MGEPENLTAENERSLETLLRAIALSQGQFSLILVRCNYKYLQERMLKQLQERSSAQINPPLILPESAKSLYLAIQDHLKLDSKSPSALVVLGLESVTAIDDLLSSCNQIRDKFRVAFSFPLVLWINDRVLQKWVKLAPDFYTWAVTPIQFVSAVDELIQFVEQEAKSLFTKVLDAGADQFLDNAAFSLGINAGKRFELESALQELASRNVLEPEVEASQKFILGRDAYAKCDMKQSYRYYKKSLNFWKQEQDLERQACLLFHLGLWWRRYASMHRAKSKKACNKARNYYQECVNLLQQANRFDLEAKFISSLAEALQQLEEWEELKKVAKEAVSLHTTYHNTVRLAKAYGFLAEIALAHSRWEKAKQHSETAIQINAQSLTSADRTQQSFLAEGANEDHYSDLGGLQRHNDSWYYLLLAKAQYQLGRLGLAFENLKTAKDMCNKDYNPQLYIRILEELRSLYFEKHQYLKAFEIKQEKLQIEKQYGFRAFIGAGRLQPQKQVVHPALVSVSSNELYANVPEILDSQGTIAQEIQASGRNEDIDCLIEKTSRTDKKLIVIHGPSGVGKSSLLTAGLVPALHQKIIEGRKPLPVVVQVYTNWITELGTALVASLGKVDVCPPVTLDSLESIVEQLRTNKERNLLTVLIFDQFEEFFLNCSKPKQRQEFWKFLHSCLDRLDIPYVKVVLSLREDYLHCLLECDRFNVLEITKNDILNQENRHSFGNFSKERAKNVIQSLTERSLEQGLINRLVDDLAEELGEIRPIELQIVGAQLQTEDITTLEKYYKIDVSSPKTKLIKYFLEEIVKDCGPENERTARLVLYLLTDENSTRPLKTHPEIAKGLAELAADLARKDDRIKEVLEILVKSGLVLMFSRTPETSADRYQLVHDYLAFLIRQEQGAGLIAELNEERKKRKRGEQKIKFLIYGIITLAVLPTILILVTWLKEVKISKATDEALASETFLTLNQNFDALLHGLRAGREFKSVDWFNIGSDTNILEQIKTSLQTAVKQVRERNRLDGHQDKVFNVSFSPEGEMLASASADRTVELWKRDGTLIKILQGHEKEVNKAIFSPDGQTIASASSDGTIKFWKRDGTLIKTLTGHNRSPIYDVTFSPDGQILASASADNTIQLWNNGILFKTLTGHKKPLNKVIFSPDGQTIASASSDRTVKLWKRDGTLIRTLTGHKGDVWDVTFSPDGQILASASADNTVKLWKHDGNLIKTLRGHHDWVWSVSFSPNGQMLASASNDQEVRLWKRDGTLINRLKGHSGPVYSVSFSPNSMTLASASSDRTVKLWKQDGNLITTLTGHQDGVSKAIFSPKDNNMLASASYDKTVILWQLDGSNGSDNSLNGLMNESCAWLHDYLNTNSAGKQEAQQLCLSKE